MNAPLNIPPAVAAPRFPAGVSLVALLRAVSDGRVLGRLPITDADLVEHRAELWRDCFLRRGLPSIPFDSVSARAIPVFVEEAGSRCAGFVLEAVAPGGVQASKTFSISSFAPVAARLVHSLSEAERSQDVSRFRLEIEASPEPAAAAFPAAGSSVKSAPLTWLRVPYRGLLRDARPVAMESSEAVFPVFITEETLALAERISRRGSPQDPLAEGGVILCGSLAGCPDTGEFFTIVTGVIEARDAIQTPSSLEFGGASWLAIGSAMRARQAAAPGRCERLLGQAHAHNYLPAEGKKCEACDHLSVCRVDNLFASTDDAQWMRCCFSRQPWQLCLIFGRNVRGDLLNALFTLDDGRLQRRGYFVLPSFSPEHWEPVSAAV